MDQKKKNLKQLTGMFDFGLSYSLSLANNNFPDGAFINQTAQCSGKVQFVLQNVFEAQELHFRLILFYSGEA